MSLHSRGDRDPTLPLERQLDRLQISERQVRQNRVSAVFIRPSAAIAHRRHVIHLKTQDSSDVLDLPMIASAAVAAQTSRERGITIQLRRHNGSRSIHLLQEHHEGPVRINVRSHETDDVGFAYGRIPADDRERIVRINFDGRTWKNRRPHALSPVSE